LIFCADDAALLTQGKEDKRKSSKKDCCEADSVRVLSAYPNLSAKNLPDYCIPESLENQPKNSNFFNFYTPTIKKARNTANL